MSSAEDLNIARAVDQIARLAVDRIAARWMAQGAIARPGTSNPYRPGTHAFKCWQRGFGTKATGSTS